MQDLERSMTEWIRTDFTIIVTSEDIEAAANSPIRNDNPIRRAIMRKFHLVYPVNVMVGWADVDVYFPEETDQFTYDQEVGEPFLRAWDRDKQVNPITINLRLLRILDRRPKPERKVAERFDKTPPRRIARSGM
jgi:hypothetical protein